MNYDVIILGAGPAGLTAGIYASRAGLKTLIIEKYFVGGQASQTAEIENFPGFSSVNGFELMQAIQEQTQKCGAEIVYGELSAVDEELKSVTLTDGAEYVGDALIIATGATHTPMGVPLENELKGKGVSYCATCDGAFFKNKTVTVLGGGNTAVGDALYLEKFAKTVYIVHRRNEFRASPALIKKLDASTVIKKTPYLASELLKGENGKLSGIVITNKENGTSEALGTDGLFVAIGQTPDTALFTKVKKDEKGYIITDENMKTNLDKVYAVGDCRQKFLRQIITACADGAIAAEQIATNK